MSETQSTVSVANPSPARGSNGKVRANQGRTRRAAPEKPTPAKPTAAAAAALAKSLETPPQTTTKVAKVDKVAKVATPKPPVTKTARAAPIPAARELIQNLVKLLPEPGTAWKQGPAVSWMQAMAKNLEVVYQLEGAITVMPAAA